MTIHNQISATDNPVHWYVNHAMREKMATMLDSLMEKGAFQKGHWHNYEALLANGSKSYSIAFDPITQKKLALNNEIRVFLANEHSSHFHNTLSNITALFLDQNKKEINSLCNGSNQDLSFHKALRSVLATCILNGMQYEFNQIADYMIECHPEGKPFGDPLVNQKLMISSDIFETKYQEKSVHLMHLAAMCCYEKCMDKMFEGGWNAHSSTYLTIQSHKSTFQDACLQIECDLMPSVVNKIWRSLDANTAGNQERSTETIEKTSDWLNNKIQSTLPVETEMVQIGLDLGFHFSTPGEHLLSASTTVHSNVVAACKDLVNWKNLDSETHPLEQYMKCSTWEADDGTPYKQPEKTGVEILKHMLSSGLSDQLKLSSGILSKDPLLHFVQTNQFEPMILCLKMGLDPDFASPDGKSASSEAAKSGNKEILEILRIHKTANTALAILDEIRMSSTATIHP